MNISRRRASQVTLLFTVLFSLLCFFYVKELRFDYDFEAFFPNEDEELSRYETFRNKFEYDNEFVLIGLENKAGIFKKDFLVKVNQLSLELNNLPNIIRVHSPTTAKRLIMGELGSVELPLLHYDRPDFYHDDSLNIYASEELVGALFPIDAASICIYVKTADKLSKVHCDSLARRIERAYTKYNFYEVHFVGRIVAQDVYLKQLSHEFVLFLSLSFILIVIFLYISFRSLYGIIVPVSIVLLSIFWTLGIMGMLGKPIDIMSVMLPTMIFIAGMSDVVHYFSKYFEELAKGTDKDEIHRLILKEVGFPTFLTLITTVVGFLSLLFSSIKPIRDFGIYTSVGIIIAFILSYTLLPALLVLWSPKKMVALHGHNNKTQSRMRMVLFWIFRNQKTILAVTVIVLALSGWGISRIRVNNILLEDLRDNTKIKQDFNFFDQHYSGVRPFELAITLKDSSKSIWDYEVMQQIQRIDEYLKKEYKTGFMLSPAILCKGLNRAINNGESGAFHFPDRETYNEDIKKLLKGNRKNKEVKRIIASDGHSARISGRISDIGSLKVKELNEGLFRFITTHTDTSLMTCTVTGAATLLDRNNEYMVSNMLQGFGWSLLIIAILTWFLHRSWRMVLVFILPNLIPMLIIAGFMGFAGIELKAATSLIFSIAFGIATDDTIHFISRFKIELTYGKSLLYAFKRTYFETGKPIILTTFILIGGFMSLMISDFQSTFLFGFLICIIIGVALIAEFFLLPVLLLMILGKHEQKSKTDKNH